MIDLIYEAAEYAREIGKDDPTKNYWIASIGIRSDGAQIKSVNGAVRLPPNYVSRFREIPGGHSEVRTLRKMDCGGILIVARTLRIKNKSLKKSLRLARPCMLCRNHIKARKISKVYYTISPHEYGVWYPYKDIDDVFEF